VKRLKGEAGQHTLEYAILIGVVTLAALTMQFYVRRGVMTGAKVVSDLILEPPPPPNISKASSSTISVVDCNGASRSATGADLVLQVSCIDVTEQGDPTFLRKTKMDERYRGASVNNDARLQVLSGSSN
jgi:hypothetical protein